MPSFSTLTYNNKWLYFALTKLPTWDSIRLMNFARAEWWRWIAFRHINLQVPILKQIGFFFTPMHYKGEVGWVFLPTTLPKNSLRLQGVQFEKLARLGNYIQWKYLKRPLCIWAQNLQDSQWLSNWLCSILFPQQKPGHPNY